jgi:outer membrane murein-binding lipoprotein Lpp
LHCNENLADLFYMKGRLLTLAVLVPALLLSGCQNTAKKKEEARQAALKKKAKTEARQENTDVDLDAFVSRLRKAVAAHDVNTLAAMMTPDFGYSLNPERSGDGVFQYWDQNNLWPELEGILSEKFVKKEDYMVAPPQFADPSLNYDGYRAGIRRVNGSWKFAYFVNG